MTQTEIYRIGDALMAWAKAKGMKAYSWMRLGERRGPTTQIRVELSEQFNSDALVPNVDFLMWKVSHPGSVTGYQNQTWNGKPASQVRGGWVDFICPVKECNYAD